LDTLESVSAGKIACPTVAALQQMNWLKTASFGRSSEAVVRSPSQESSRAASKIGGG
jgi:hypothetical protein